MMLLSKYRKNDSGASATEFALAVPLIVLLFYGMAQFGLILLANTGLRQAIDTGARDNGLYRRNAHDGCPNSDNCLQQPIRHDQWHGFNASCDQGDQQRRQLCQHKHFVRRTD